MTTLRIIGNAPSAAEGLETRFGGIYLGVNSAPVLFHEKGVTCDNCWIQDWRFIDEKGHQFDGMDQTLSKTHLFVCSYFRSTKLPFKDITTVRSLGREGLSLDPARGVFEGYSVAYGALQLALRWKPSRIELYGVDFSYSLGSNRFYQTRVGWDLDLHVHERQIATMQNAKRSIEDKRGIEVAFMTNSFVNTMIPVHGLAEI